MRVQALFLPATVTVLLATCLVTSQADAQTAQYASKQRASAAAGYYARSRAMLVEALAEFEQGRKYARPDLVVDAEEWRLTLISLTEELNRLVDPKVRVTRDGVRFAGNPRMVRRERDRLPPAPDGPQDRNTYGEEQRMKELEKSRKDLYDVPSDEGQGEAKQQEQGSEEQTSEESAAQDAEAAKAQQKQTVEQVIESAVGEAGIPQSQKEALGLDSEGPNDEKNVANEGSETEAEKLKEGGKDQSEDQQVTSAIDDAIKERLKSLEVGTDQSGTEGASAAKGGAAAAGSGEESEEGGGDDSDGEQTTNPGIE